MFNPFEDSLLYRYRTVKNQIKIIVCDKCKGEFKVEEVKLKEYVMESKLKNLWFRVTWYNCPHCNEVYLVMVETLKSSKMKNEYMKLVAKMKSNPTEKIQKKLDRLKNKLEVENAFNMKRFGETLSQVIKEAFNN